jgi:hypothetical protein
VNGVDKNQILMRLSESKQTNFGKVDFAEQSIPQKVFSAIWALESEVNNGGFSQFFLNGSAETASFVSEALNSVHAPKTADICRRAVETAFPSGLPDSVEAIQSESADFSDQTLDALNALDQEFFTYPHDLTELLYDFVVKHPQEFGDVPQAD